MADQFAFRRVSHPNRTRKISDILLVHQLKLKPLNLLEHRHIVLFLLKDQLSLKEIPITWQS
jgi:hypothetical protein